MRTADSVDAIFTAKGTWDTFREEKNLFKSSSECRRTKV